MALTPGTRLGVYEITAQIGEGGMGQVFRATDTKLKRQVAIKTLPPAVATDAERLARFQREAEVLASLNHPNIAGIYGLEESGGMTALVMELVEGEDLSQRIAKGAIPLDEALPIAKQIAEALEAAHERGIVHRDLKPANIKVRSDGTVKVLDFGLAKAMEPTGAMSASASMSPTITTPAMVTGAGMILGTAAYMSPEQARGKAVDKRADIWAFGAVLFEMLTGKRAFPGEDVTDTLAAVVRAEPEWTLLPAGLSSALVTFLKRCLHKDPKQRIPDIAAMRLALDGVFDTPVPQTSETTSASTPARGGRLAWMAFAVALLVAAALAVPAVRYWRQAPRQADTLARFSVTAPAGAVRPTRSAEGVFSVTPDGQTLAFAARDAAGVSRIFVRRLDATEAQPVAGTDRATYPFWAPDGRSLGFAKEGGLYRVALDGSAPRRLCDVPGGVLRGGTWGARGVIVFGSASNGLLQVPDTGGTPTPVTTLDAAAKEGSHVSPWFLPDGRHVLFLALAQGQARGTLWATAIDDPARTRIGESSGGAAYASGWLLSTTNAPRTLIAQPFDPARLTLEGTPQPIRDGLPDVAIAGFAGFTVSSSGALIVDRPPPLVSQLTWLDRSGRVLAAASPRAQIPAFTLAPDERRIVADLRPLDAARRALWLFDEIHADGTRLTYDGGTNRPVWALDGRHVYFGARTAAYPLGSQTLDLGTSTPTRFEHRGPVSYVEDVTRDGRYVIFRSISVPAGVWTQQIGSDDRRVLVQGPFSATRPRVSPDSRWLAYTLELPTGPEVFVQPFDRPGDRIQVSVHGGFGPVWRDDGRELYYEGPEGLMAVPLSTRGDTLESGAPQKLFAIRTQGTVADFPHNFEVAAHGQKFLVNSIIGDSDNAPLEVTLNWTAGLTK